MIRKLQIDDWQIYKDIHLECIKSTPWAFAAKYDVEITKDDTYWQGIVNNPSRTMFGLFVDEVMIAISGLQIVSNQQDIDIKVNVVSVYCKPEFRGKGHIDKLLNYVISYQYEYIKGRLYLAVEKNNIAAINLYKKLSFIYDKDLPSRIMADGLLHDEIQMKHVRD